MTELQTITDLLKPGSTNLKIKENFHGEVYVGDLTEEAVGSPEAVMDILETSFNSRQVAATKMNETSSRSHTVFQITVESQSSNPEDDSTVRVAKLNLVDLAGSERVGNTGAAGDRLTEAGNINKSLLTLGTVIGKLADGAKAHIPYRDSKLTRILQNSLGGNAKTAIICAVTPASAHVEETLSSLKFANRAKNIKNTATVNEVVDDATQMKRQQQQIAQLTKQVDAYKNGVAGQEVSKLSEELQESKEQIALKEQELERIKSLVVLSGSPKKELSKSKRSSRRETWCPGQTRNGTRLRQSMGVLGAGKTSLLQTPGKSARKQPRRVSVAPRQGQGDEFATPSTRKVTSRRGGRKSMMPGFDVAMATPSKDPSVQHVERLEKENRGHVSRIKELEGQCDQSNAMFEKMMARAAEHKGVPQETVDEMQQQLDSYAERVRSLERDVGDAKENEEFMKVELECIQGGEGNAIGTERLLSPTKVESERQVLLEQIEAAKARLEAQKSEQAQALEQIKKEATVTAKAAQADLEKYLYDKIEELQTGGRGALLQQNIDGLQKQLEDAEDEHESEIETIQGDNRNDIESLTKGHAEELASLAAALNGRVAQLEAEFSAAKTQADAEKASLHDQLEAARSELLAGAGTAIELQQKLIATQSESQAASASLAVALATAVELQDGMLSLTEQRNAAGQEAMSLQAQLESATTEISQLTEQRNAAGQEAMSLQDQLESATAEIGQADSKIASTSAAQAEKLAALQARVLEYEIKLAESQAAADEQSALFAQVSTALDELEAKLAKSQAATEEQSAKFGEVSTELDAVTAAAAFMEAETAAAVAAAAVKAEEMTSLQAHVISLEEQAESAFNTRTSLLQQVAAYEAQLADNSATAANSVAAEGIAEELADAKDQVIKFETRLAEADNFRAALAEQVKEYEVIISGSQATIEQFHQQATEYETAMADAQIESQRQQQQIAESEAGLAAANTAVDAQTAKTSAIAAELNECTAAAAAMEAAALETDSVVVAMREQVADYKTRLVDAQAAGEAFVKEMECVAAQLVTANAKAEEHQATIAELTAKIAEEAEEEAEEAAGDKRAADDSQPTRTPKRKRLLSMVKSSPFVRKLTTKKKGNKRKLFKKGDISSPSSENLFSTSDRVGKLMTPASALHDAELSEAEALDAARRDLKAAQNELSQAEDSVYKSKSDLAQTKARVNELEDQLVESITMNAKLQMALDSSNKHMAEETERNMTPEPRVSEEQWSELQLENTRLVTKVKALGREMMAASMVDGTSMAPVVGSQPIPPTAPVMCSVEIQTTPNVELEATGVEHAPAAAPIAMDSAELDAAKQELAELQTEHERVEDEVLEHLEIQEGLKTQLEAAQMQRMDDMERFAEVQSASEAAKRKVEEHEIVAASLQAAKTDLEAQIESVTAENIELQAQLLSSSASADENAGQLDEFRQQVDTLHDEVVAGAAAVRQAQGGADAAIAEKAALLDDVAQKAEQLAEQALAAQAAQDRLTGLETELSTVSATLSEAQSLQEAGNEDSTRQLTECLAQRDELLEQLNILSTSAEMVTNERDASMEEASALVQRVAELTAASGDVAASFDGQLQEKARQLSETTNAINEVVAENSRLEAEADSALARVTMLEGSLVKLEAQAAAQDENSAAAGELAEAQQEIDNLQQAQSGMIDELETVEIEMSKVRGEVAVYTGRIAELEAQVKATGQDRDAAMKASESQMDALLEFETKVQALQGEVASKTAKIEGLKKKNAKLTKQLTAGKEMLENLEAQKEEEVTELQNIVDNQQVELKQQTTGAAASESAELADYKAKVESLMEKMARGAKYVADADTRVAAAENDVSTSADKLVHLEKAIEEQKRTAASGNGLREANLNAALAQANAEIRQLRQATGDCGPRTTGSKIVDDEVIETLAMQNKSMRRAIDKKDRKRAERVAKRQAEAEAEAEANTETGPGTPDAASAPPAAKRRGILKDSNRSTDDKAAIKPKKVVVHQDQARAEAPAQTQPAAVVSLSAPPPATPSTQLQWRSSFRKTASMPTKTTTRATEAASATEEEPAECNTQ